MKKEKRNEERKGRIKEKNQNITVLYWSRTIRKVIYFCSRAEASLDLECISACQLPELQSVPSAPVHLIPNCAVLIYELPGILDFKKSALQQESNVGSSLFSFSLSKCNINELYSNSRHCSTVREAHRDG